MNFALLFVHDSRLTKTRATALERMGVIGDSDSNSSKHSSS